MRVPLSLLKRFVDIPVDVSELASLMNGRIAEVESVHLAPSSADLVDVQAVRLEKKLGGDNAFGLWQVQGTESFCVVVGEKYGVQAKEIYAAIAAGGTLPSGQPVEARMVGGFESQGMLVSEEMLGIGEEAARPLGLAPEVVPGAPVHAVLELDDPILEFDLEPNRPDLFSLVGMARDLAAIFDRPLSTPQALDPDSWGDLPPSDLSIRIDSPDKVQRYAALEVSGVRVGPSPQPLQNAVRKLGMRPINNVVDAANLAMLELGQPMHTFDRAVLKSGEIGLRMARDDEKLTTLDGEERTLTNECLLVTDGDTPIALAGVMGDSHSGITEGTTDLIIESATFDMAAVRRCSRRLSLRTESSLRFEKGLPASQVVPAMARLAELLVEHGGPKVTVGRLADVFPGRQAPTTIPFCPGKARSRLGMQVEDALIRSRFRHQGFQVDNDWRVTVPDTRPDLRIQADLNEEVGRIHGYEHVVAQAPTAPLGVPRENPVYTKGFAVRRSLAGAGLDEVYLGIWVGEREVEKFGLERDSLLALKNPLASNLRWFRPTALPDVLGALHLNRKSQERVGLFEIAKIYWRGEAGEVVERHHLSGGLSTPGEDETGARFYTARDAVMGALEALGTEPILHRGDPAPWMMASCFHPGRTAVLSVEGTAVALVGELHPSLVGRLGLEDAPVTFHVDLEALLPLHAPIHRFVPPPRFPSVEYHLNVLAPEKTWAEDVLSLVSDAKLSHLQARRLQAVYAGRGVPSGQKRLTLEVVFNHPERSLTHDEARAEMEKLRGQLEASGLTVEM